MTTTPENEQPAVTTPVPAESLPPVPPPPAVESEPAALAEPATLSETTVLPEPVAQAEPVAQGEAPIATVPVAQPQVPAAAAPAAAAPPLATQPHALTQPQLSTDPQYAAQPAYSAPNAGGTVPPAFGGPAPAAAEPQAPKHRSGGLIAGLVVGALIGGLVGGGTAAVVAHNVGGQTVVQAASGEKSGSLTLNNVDSATAITGVALVATPSVVTLQVSDGSSGGSGSGVIYTEDGYIITNAHVATLSGLTADPTIRVQTSDGTLYEGVLVGSDPFADIAVVKIEAEGLTPVALGDSSDMNVGDLAIAIGAPLNLSNTVTSGVVSALGRGISVASSMVEEIPEEEEQPQNNPFPWFQYQTPNDQQQPQQSTSAGARVAIPVLQTDASINPGNSGGGLFNANAELIGINVALASANASSGAAGSDGLGFAVPANLAVRVADALIAGERPSHGLLGVTQSSTSSTTSQTGGVVGEVNPGSPAEQAGLRSGDVITSVDGMLVDSYVTVTALIRMHAGGDEVVIGYNRDGKQGEVSVVLDTLDW